MATTAPPAKRAQSSTTAIPTTKPTCRIHSLAIIADRVQLTGSHNVDIGENTILHPYAKISADKGNISIGRHCIIAEKTVVGSPSGSLTVEDGVSIESGAVVEGTRVGEWSIIGVNAKVGRGAVVGRWCTVGALCEVGEGEVVEDFTVVFGCRERRVDALLRESEEIKEMRAKGRRMEVELLRTLIPDAGAKLRG